VALSPHQGLVDDLQDEIVVAPAEGAGHPGEAGVARQVGARVHLEHVGLAFLVDPEVDAAVALAARHVHPRLARDLADPLAELRGYLGGAHRLRALVLGTARDPLGGVAHDGPGPVGHAVEADLGDRQHALAHEADVELPPGDVFLDQDLLELLEHLSDALLERALGGADGAVVDPDTGVLGRRLHDGRERELARRLVRLSQHERRHRQAGRREERVGDVLPVTDGRGPGAAAGERHPSQLERPHDQVLVAGVAVDPLAQIEDEVDPADPAEPAEVAKTHGQQFHLVPPAPQDIAHLVDIAHDGRHVLRTPLVAAGIVQDRHFHHATSARSERPLIRRHAMSATVRISSS